MTYPTESKAVRKPKKPSKKFPLFAHPSGQWAKKIRKRLVYFGSWRKDPKGEAAEKRYDLEIPYLKEGRTPPAVDVSKGLTLQLLVNSFLTSKKQKLNVGELSPRSFRDYYKTCERLVNHFGRERLVTDLKPDDFGGYRKKLAERFGPVTLKNEITRVSTVFNYAHDNNLIEKPVSYGQEFDRPSAKALRKAKNEGGPKLFTAEEARRLLGYPPWTPAADTELEAMILLGINCGFGNTDVASLPESALNLDDGWVNFPRPKTEIPRRVPLWPETVAALRRVLAARPSAFDPSARGLVFLTRQGRAWVRTKDKKRAAEVKGPEHDVKVPIDALSAQFGKLLKKLHINGRRGLGFYTLRHCFETIAGESKDQVAVNSIMGHVDPSMAANYRHGVSDERLRAVVETVRAWLFGSLRTEGGEL